MKLHITQVDAFTREPFRGNPAAVCALDAPLDEALMQRIAMEMNLSETAFLHPLDDGGYRLRWFTPESEVRLCGHATLASAHALWEAGAVSHDASIVFHTLSGPLAATRREDGRIVMDFPARAISVELAPAELYSALGVAPTFVGVSEGNYLVEVASEDVLRGLTPDLRLLSQLPHWGTIVTSASKSPEYDFISRFFAPAKGVGEDPVTGSAHCTLAPYWSRKLGKVQMTGYQASKRGGVVGVEDAADRVKLSGYAVTVMHGELTI
jgi:PhzF family phenazine biosynthesis protein